MGDASDQAEKFIAAWRDTGGSELADTQSFVNGLCDLLGVPSPNGSRADDAANDYVFERRVFANNGDGTTSFGRIDCYRRGAFMRCKQNSRTSCPNPSTSAHVEDKAPAAPAEASCPIMQELDAEFRNPHGLRKRAEYHARRCQTDPDDLLSTAIERALRRPQWDKGVRERIESILSSLASTINRARARAKLRSTDLMSLDDGTIVDRHFPCLRDAAEAGEIEARRRGSEKALQLIARGEPKLHALINGIGLGLSGKHLQTSMGVTELQLATLRRRLKRSAQVVCAPFSSGSRIDAQWLEELAA